MPPSEAAPIAGSQFSCTEKMRFYALAWFFDHLAQGNSPHEAYEEVLACLELLRKREVVHD